MDRGERMKNDRATDIIKGTMLLLAALSVISGAVFQIIPPNAVRWLLIGFGAVVFAMILLWDFLNKRKLSRFSNDICDTVEALMEEREPDGFHPYEETEASKVQGKLLQYYDKMKDGRRQSLEDKQTIQELVSDISHQVKTPITNVRMFAGILQQRQLTDEKRAEFLGMMDAQIGKLDFLMMSLIKMSRLETGTFSMQMEENSLEQTIARAVSTVWTKAEQKKIELEVECDSQIRLRHDAKWTAEALGNLLDNAVKYTPEGGSVRVNVRPWQFYTRIDVVDTGIGIAEKHYNDVFQRFFRAQETAAEEGVGLGLYLARSIITRQNGYISVKSGAGMGTVFSVYLPSLQN